MEQFDPNRRDFAPYGLTCVRWKPSPMKRPDHHNEVEINLLESGWVTYLLGGRKVRVGSDKLTAFWAAIPHQIIDYGAKTAYFVVTIPFSWFLQFKLPERFVQPLLRGEVITEPDERPIDRDLELFARWEKDLETKQEDLNQIVMLEIEARLRRLGLHLPAPIPEGETEKGKARGGFPALHEGGLNKVEQMACFIAQRYTDPLTVEDIAAAVGLHPNYSMSLFKKAFGTTLIDYLTHHRVSHAQRLLATTDTKIVDVAFASGFNSISRFNEAFRRGCGQSPRDYRRAHFISS